MGRSHLTQKGKDIRSHALQSGRRTSYMELGRDESFDPMLYIVAHVEDRNSKQPTHARPPVIQNCSLGRSVPNGLTPSRLIPTTVSLLLNFQPVKCAATVSETRGATTASQGGRTD